VNGKEFADFFVEERDRQNILAVLDKTGLKGKVDVKVNACGGGTTGQCGATILGLGRAVLNFDSTLEAILREHAFLTRDARKVERKKYGQAGARRRFQFSKR
jgi:small subunit ribosomal protein S9